MQCNTTPHGLYIYVLVGYKHRASEGVFYIGGCGCVLCQFIEPVRVARLYFISEYRIGRIFRCTCM